MANTYLLLYSGGNMPATEAEQKQVMNAWNSWFAKHGDAISDGGNPFTAKAKTIGSDGKVTDGAFAAATGYTLIKADSLDKAVEIDSYPDRQDLNVTLLKIARKAGVRISLGTDSHHAHQLEFIELGLAAALKARIPPDRIVNFMDLRSLRAWVKKLRERRQ